MRVEEKQIDGLDLEHREEQQETLLAETKEAKLPVLVGEEVQDLEEERSAQLMVAMRMIFERKHLNVTHLRMPQRETLALEALQAAVNGRSTNVDQFVYASDRRSKLEQALAILQPNLTRGAEQQLAAMNQDFNILSKQVSELRHCLMNLEDGQDELMSNDRERRIDKAEDAETTDKPTSDPDAPRPASTLSNGGPDGTRETAPTTLTGPEITAETKSSTTLGDAEEISAEAKKNPWWKRIVRG